MNHPLLEHSPRACARLLPYFVCALLWLAPLARAHASTTVLVLSSGDENSQQLLQANALVALEKTGVQVTSMEDAVLAGFDPAFTLSCLENDEICDALLKKAPAEWILLLRLAASGDDADADRTVLGRLYSAGDGSTLQVEQSVCQRCGSNERLAQEVSELVEAMVSDELANKATETYLDVSSSPSMALLRIDGTVVGQTGQAYRVSPGTHTIELELEGYRSARQELQVAANEHKALRVTLSKAEAADTDGIGMRRILAYGALGLGAGALATGVTMLVIDGESANASGERGRVNDTKGVGIASLVLGGLFVGGGVALLLTGEDDHRDMHVSAMPSSDGFALGMSGHF